VNALGDTEHVAGIGAGFEEDGEFVASEAREQSVRGGMITRTGEPIRGAERGLETIRGFHEHPIPGSGAQRVIERFERVQIEEQQRVLETAIPLPACEAALQAIEEEAAIGQIGQCVVEGVVSQLLFGGDALGDITIDDDQLLHFAAIILDSAGSGFEDAPLAIFVAETILQVLADASGAGFAAGFEDFETVIGMNLLEDGRAGEFVGRVAQDFFIGGAVVEAVALGVDEGNHVGGVLGDDAKELFAIAGAAVDEVDPGGLGGDDGEG
jgi:hypothetical protein